MQTYAEVSTFMDNLSLYLKVNPDLFIFFCNFLFFFQAATETFLIQARSASSKIVFRFCSRVFFFYSYPFEDARTTYRQNTHSVVTSKNQTVCSLSAGGPGLNAAAFGEIKRNNEHLNACKTISKCSTLIGMQRFVSEK